MTTKLFIESHDNEDWNGEWLKEDVEQEMRELDNPPKDGNEWIAWVLGHMFSFGDDLPAHVENALIECDEVTQIIMKRDNGHVKITKA